MRRLKTWLLVGTLVAALAGVIIWRSQFTTKVPEVKLDLDEIEAMTTFDQSDWAEVLQRYVDDQGRVDYAGLKAHPEALHRYVALIGKIGPTTRPKLFPTAGDMLAYYINAYNALTLYNVVMRYPIASVRDEQADFFMFTQFVVDGEDISLHQLEKRYVIKKFKQEPRAHFALNCASLGCPTLPRTPFPGGEALDARLAEETQKLLSDPQHFALKDGVPHLSQIFQWYGDQFTPTPVAWIRAQRPDLEIPEGATPKYMPYDWSLNDQR